jgi:hypothetical protein
MSDSREILYPRYISPFGKSWEDWAILWWQWCSAQSDDTNPAADTTGINCHRNQRESSVWFLAGTFGGSAVRHCNVPKGRSFLFPIITDRISYAEHGYLKSEEELYDYAKADLDSARIYEAYVDGVKLKYLESYRVRTGLFKFTAPAGQFGNVAEDRFQGISDGYWVFLRPLPEGEHTIFFFGEKLRFDEVYLAAFNGDEPVFRVEVKYFISIK